MNILCSQKECMEHGCVFPDCLDEKPKKIYESCEGCKKTGMYPSHNGSKNCESGSIASGGNKSHCSCDICF